MSIPYKSFCWCFGTTSFRTKNFNKTIEEQLFLLNDFWNLPENEKLTWNGNNELQSKYYDFMKEKEFVIGNAPNKPKDAREKTSGLADIGLIDGGRRLTETGLKLLSISIKADFSSDNFLQIDKDSYIYLKQLLKTYNTIDNDTVRPFIVFLYVLSKVGYLTIDEYTYLLPLCTNKIYTDEIIDGIISCRNKMITIDEIIIKRLMSMNNYQRAYELLLNGTVTEDLLCEIGLNRKSRQYDKSYFKLYKELYAVYVNKNKASIHSAYLATKDIKIGRLWRILLFTTSSENAIIKDPTSSLQSTLFDKVTNEIQFKDAFFKLMHLLKAKATLSDYLDLNRRYIKTTDIVLFEDSVIKLDIVPKYFFNTIIDELYIEAYSPCLFLSQNIPLEQISKSLIENVDSIISGINYEFNTSIRTLEEAKNVLEDKRYERLHHLIDNKFSDENMLHLLDCFENRNDEEIRRLVTDNADVPTIFEYVLGILWYKVSEFEGNILNYLKLSLDADLLPKTHAAGGEADIVYEYANSTYYPKHTLLLEATLADSTNQRRMEMEPVSRHLGNHLIKSKNLNSYCVFATNFLNINVIADFRGRKYMPYYNSQDYNQSVNGMKIIPLQTSELKSIIKNKHKYKNLYPIFEEAYQSTLQPHEWYAGEIVSRIN